LLERFASEITDASDHRGDLRVDVRPSAIRDVVGFLKTDPALQFNVMMDLFAMDYLKYPVEQPERFAVIYNLYSLPKRHRVHLRVFVPEQRPEVDTIQDLYAAANWFEREAWDLFGIVFKGHPNLVRILCHTDFVGHPMRKDYPSTQYQRLKNAAPSSGF
jgi:NADH/F420H2 dehydrogenase subunit C